MKKFTLPALLVASLALLLFLGGTLDRRFVPAAETDALLPPRVSLPAGAYERAIQLRLQPNYPRGRILFTTDGTMPGITVTTALSSPRPVMIGTLYTQPLRLDSAFPTVMTLRAVEVVGDEVGPPLEATYSVGVHGQLPILSLTAVPVDLWGRERGIFTHPSWRGRAWERAVHIALLPPAGEATLLVGTGLRIHGMEPRSAPKQSLRLYFRGDYGAARLTHPLFPDHPRLPEREQSYDRLLLQAGDLTPQWTLLRDQLVAETATEMGLIAAQGRLVCLFINGQSWGVYRLTERVDRFFGGEGDDIFDEADIVQEGKAREGSDEAWDAMIDWVAARDLAVPAHYTQIRSQIDLENFTEVAILRAYFGFPADALYAVRPRGGRWQWIYAGGGRAQEESDLEILLAALLKTPDYRAYFAARLADLLNTQLAAETVAARLTRISATLAQDFPLERARWPNIAPLEMQTSWLMADLRARPAALLAEYVPQGTAALHFAAIPPEGGRVYVNGQAMSEGRYAISTTLKLTAAPTAGYAFAGWERGDPAPVLSVTVAASDTLTANFAPRSASDAAPRPDAVIINELWLNDDGTHYANLGQPLEGDWIELLVQQRAGVDLRGWRLTDNDTKRGTTEGSIIFPTLDALARVPYDTRILIVASEHELNAAAFLRDDLDAGDGRLIFYVGNGELDIATDPGFGLGPRDDNLVLLAPGATADFADDIGVDFVAEGDAVSPYTFGILADGVRWPTPFRYLGRDDGAFFTGDERNDDVSDWRSDPTACQSGDAICLNEENLLTPGDFNPGQRRLGYRLRQLWR